MPSEAWDDYIWGPGPPFDGSILFEFKNLDPGLYNLSVFLGSGGGGQFGTIWAGALGDEPGGQNTGSYVGGSSTLAGLTIGAGDSLFFRHLEDGSGGTSGIIVRQTAAAIPEPSTFVLATLGLLSLGLCGRRRRRR